MAAKSDAMVLPPEVVAKLFGQARPVALARNRTLFRAGDACDGCYQIIDGLVKITILAEHRERILAIQGPGALVGELSLIDGARRSAAVTAIRDSRLAFVSREAFEAFA